MHYTPKCCNKLEITRVSSPQAQPFAKNKWEPLTEQFLPPGAASESSKYGSVNDGFDEEERKQPENVASAPKYRKNPDAF